MARSELLNSADKPPHDYDGRDRLVEAERYDNTPTLLHRYTYTYDDGDNMATKAIYDPSGPTTVTTTFTYNDANELTNTNDGTTSIDMTYDEWGRLTEKDDGTHTATYAYRYSSKLYSVTSNFPDEGNVTYETGGDGKRRSRVAGTSETWYNWDLGLNLLSEEDGTGTVLRSYTNEPLHSRLSLRTQRSQALAASLGINPATGTWGFLALDQIWSIRGAFDQSKLQVASFEYTPYGDVYYQTTTMSIIATFASHQWDGAVGMYAAPFRFYSANQARWIQRDPLGMVDGPNVYAYVRGNPASAVDLLGLRLIDDLPAAVRDVYNYTNADCPSVNDCLKRELNNSDAANLCPNACSCFASVGVGTSVISACTTACEEGLGWRPGLGCAMSYSERSGSKTGDLTTIVMLLLALFLNGRRSKRPSVSRARANR